MRTAIGCVSSLYEIIAYLLTHHTLSQTRPHIFGITIINLRLRGSWRRFCLRSHLLLRQPSRLKQYIWVAIYSSCEIFCIVRKVKIYAKPSSPSRVQIYWTRTSEY